MVRHAPPRDVWGLQNQKDNPMRQNAGRIKNKTDTDKLIDAACIAGEVPAAVSRWDGNKSEQVAMDHLTERPTGIAE